MSNVSLLWDILAQTSFPDGSVSIRGRPQNKRNFGPTCYTTGYGKDLKHAIKDMKATYRNAIVKKDHVETVCGEELTFSCHAEAMFHLFDGPPHQFYEQEG